jgi:predicted nicotinamide N-methyase
MQGAALVIANDTDPFACIAATHNSTCNGAADIITCSSDLLPLRSNSHDAFAAVTALEQRVSLHAPHVSAAAPRLLLLGDMLYDADIGPRVLALADAACSRGWRVATGDPGRCIAASQTHRLGTRVACFDLSQELRANNHGMAQSSVYVARGD